MKHRVSACLICILLHCACADRLSPAPAANNLLAEPVEGLSPAQSLLHIEGDEAFARTFGPDDGLGPVFNEPGCEFCHIGDGKGHPLTSLRRFGRTRPDGTWDPMPEAGGPQLQDRAIPGGEPEMLPDGVAVTTLLPPNVTGLGYLEAVTDWTLLALADPHDSDGDGISGRVQLVEPPSFFEPEPWRVALTRSTDGVTDGVVRYIGRFGRKATTLDLLHQTAGAYLNDIGITTDFFPTDLPAPGGGGAGDGVAEPELGNAEVEAVVFYLRTLKVPPRRNVADPNVVAGEELFGKIGCAGCHVPTLTTGPSAIAPLSEVTIHPYTDLLLHDMGQELDDGYRDGNELSSEWRTPPLWGLGLQKESQGGRMFLLHDGRATSFHDAIALHGGEAAASRDRYLALGSSEQDQLLAFLESL